MGLQDKVKELKDQIEKASELEKEEEKTALEALNTVVEEIKKPEEEKTAEEAPKEEAKPDETKTDEVPKEEKTAEEKTPAEHAKERIAKKREKDRLSEELATARERIAALEAKQTPVEQERKTVVDAEPNQMGQPLEWAQWKLRQQDKVIESISGWKAEQETVKKRETIKEQAMREVESFENQLRPAHPDYDEVKNYYARMLAMSIKIVNPKITDSQLGEAVQNRLLTRASELLAEGYENPVEAMYLDAKKLGYQPQKKAEETDKEEPKPDMEKVAQLRKRNAGMAGASGSGGEADVTAKVAAKMTNAEFAKLKPEQKKRLFESLRNAG